MLHFTSTNTSIGKIGLVREEDYLIKVSLPNEELTTTLLKKIYPGEKIDQTNSGFENIITQLTEYFSRKRTQFDIKTKLILPPFYLKVIETVAKIPYGQTVSYKQIADKVGNPKGARAVGTANARNPLPIIIPCHRVIATNGRLGGYAGGVNLKKYLIEFERLNLKKKSNV